MKFEQKLNVVKGKLFINNEFVDSKGGRMFDVINPSDETIICQSVAATSEDVEIAVNAARKAFDDGEWRKMDDFQRGKIIYKFADLIEQNTQWLAYFESLNNGKPFTLAKTQDIPISVKIYRYFAGQADKIKGKTLPVCKPYIGFTKKEPIGVVGQIIPWNHPLRMMCWKVAPALAAGCTIVLKPAEQTPITTLMMGILIKQAGFPPGVINILSGFGSTGASICQHKLVDKISFTGSTEVGYIIMRNSHKHNLKPITLELGGKSANIIMPDADLQEACDQACIVFDNNGQSCIAPSRTFVHQSIYDKFVEGAIKKAKSIKVGHPMDESSMQGAIISKEQFDKIMYYIEEGKREGAKIVTGGRRIGEKGYFIEPTIFINVEDNMKIAKQQIFGPVMCLLKWKDEEDVIQRANHLPYGLGAGIMTNDVNKVLKFSQRLNAGSVYVNCYRVTEGGTPFGGFKDSGIGKDLGDEGLESYLVTKTVIIKAKL